MSSHVRGDCFTHELPLVLLGHQERELDVAFDTARQAYNALLGESLRRLDLLRERKQYRRALKLRGRSKARAFNELRSEIGFSQFELHTWASRHLTTTWLAEHLDATVVRSLSERAFRATQQHAFGKRGRPRFRGRNMLDSIEGQSNRQGLRYDAGSITWNGASFPVPRSYRVELDDGTRTKYALSHRVVRVRIVRRRLGSKVRYWMQLVLAGRPYQDPNTVQRTGTVGVDPGPRIFAILSDQLAARVDLSVSLEVGRRALRRYQRSLERKLGKAPGRGRRSAAARRERDRLADAYRRAAATRRNLHGRLANAVLTLGNEIHVEHNNIRSFQRSFGRSITNAAPAAFILLLERKAANAGVRFARIPVTMRLSQTCHGCGVIQKKPLAQRIHRCACGVEAQRDIYSALLLAYLVPTRCKPGWRLDADLLSQRWSGVRSRLPAASSPLSIDALVAEIEQTARCAQRGARPVKGIERFAGAVSAKRCEARDVVADEARARESIAGSEPVQSRASRVTADTFV